MISLSRTIFVDDLHFRLVNFRQKPEVIKKLNILVSLDWQWAQSIQCRIWMKAIMVRGRSIFVSLWYYLHKTIWTFEQSIIYFVQSVAIKMVCRRIEVYSKQLSKELSCLPLRIRGKVCMLSHSEISNRSHLLLHSIPLTFLINKFTFFRLLRFWFSFLFYI